MTKNHFSHIALTADALAFTNGSNHCYMVVLTIIFLRFIKASSHPVFSVLRRKHRMLCRKRLAADAELVLRPYQEIAFSLENAQDGGYLWEYETDAVVRAYDDLFTAEDENFDLWIREDLVNEPNAAPGASGLHLYAVSANKPGTYAYV